MRLFTLLQYIQAGEEIDNARIFETYYRLPEIYRNHMSLWEFANHIYDDLTHMNSADPEDEIDRHRMGLHWASQCALIPAKQLIRYMTYLCAEYV